MLSVEHGLRERIADLEEQVLYWRGIVQASGNEDDLGRLTTALHLSPSGAWLLAEMYRLNGRPLNKTRIRHGMPGHSDGEERCDNTINVQICRVRKALPNPAMVQTVRGLGFHLSPAGIAHVATILGK